MIEVIGAFMYQKNELHLKIQYINYLCKKLGFFLSI